MNECMNEKWSNLINRAVLVCVLFHLIALSLTFSVIQLVQLGGLQVLELYLEVLQQLLSLRVGFYLGLCSWNSDAHEARHGHHCQIRMDVITYSLLAGRRGNEHKALCFLSGRGPTNVHNSCPNLLGRIAHSVVGDDSRLITS